MLKPASNAYTIEHGLPLGPDPKQDKVDSRRASKIVKSAQSLRTRQFPPIRYIVRRFIAEGCTILAGRPKLGKSWLVLEMGLAVSTPAGTCLGGIECEHGDVLFLALEDNERRLQSRIDKVLGPLREWPERFYYETEWPRANDGGIDAIEQWILSVEDPRLVVVDVLAMFRPVSGSKDNLYETDYLAVKGLQALASKYHVAIIIVHHTRKGGSDIDPFEKVSGTLGLSGAADTTLVLDRDGNGATLYGRGRDIEEIESAVEFNKGDCRWFEIGAANEVRRTDERGTILRALLEAEEPLGPREIAIAADAPRNNVDQLLYKMHKDGEVLKTGRGKYVHPTRRDLIKGNVPPPDKNDKKIRNEDETQGQQGFADRKLLIEDVVVDKKQGELNENDPALLINTESRDKNANPQEQANLIDLTDLIAPSSQGVARVEDDDQEPGEVIP